MNLDDFDLKYVMCFCIKDDFVLMEKRLKLPWKNKWNGVGGKIELGEKPLDAIQREIFEETEIDLHKNSTLTFSGLLSWNLNSHNPEDKNMQRIPGLYLYLAQMKQNFRIWKNEKTSEIGTFAWKPLDWISTQNNNEVASNIAYYLPKMMTLSTPQRYHCTFEHEKLTKTTHSDLEFY